MLIDETIPFGCRDYFIFLTLLLVARGMDFFSTWVATPHMVLEGNPIAKRLGWKWGGLLNLGMCVGFGCAPLPAIIISTTSLLVAARNFQGAWLMRTMGEHAYRAWMTDRMNEGRTDLLLFCLLSQCLLTAAIGGALLWMGGGLLIPVGVGIGVVAYAAAVFIYSLLGIWRRRHRG